MDTCRKCCHRFENPLAGTVFGLVNMLYCVLGLATGATLVLFSTQEYFYDDLKGSNKIIKFPRWKYIGGTLIIEGVITLAASVTLLVGSYMSRPILMVPFLILKMVAIIINFFIVLVEGILLCFSSSWLFISFGTAILVFGFTVWGVELYLWLCIFSLHEILSKLVSTKTVNEDQ